MRRKFPSIWTLIIRSSTFFLFSFLLLSASAYSQSNGLAIGYGLGNFNPREDFGKIPYERSHEFLYLSYSRWFKLSQNGEFVLEPFVVYTYRTTSGFDIGLNLLYRYHLWNSDSSKNSFFFTIGPGGVYTTLDFTEQGSHFLFVLQAGLAFKLDRYFIEFRHRHYSNGGTASPNVGVETELLSVGFYF